jgi:hypothetical protein
MLTMRAAFAALLLLAGASPGATPPRWVQPIVDTGPVHAASTVASVRGPGGRQYVAVAQDAMLTIHSFAPGGGSAVTRDLSYLDLGSPTEMGLLSDGSQSVWLYFVAYSRRSLLRLGPDASVQARIDLTLLPSGRLELLPDGGLALLSGRDLTVFHSDGQQRWASTAAAGEYFDAASAAADGTHWLLYESSNGGSTRKLRQVSVAGATLRDVELPCAECIRSGFPSVLALADGSVLVAIERGALMRIGADGTLAWKRFLDSNVQRIQPGPDQHATVVLADGRLRAIRIDSGDPAWTLTGDRHFAHAAGALVVLKHTDLEISVQSFSAEGSLLAQQRVDLAALGYSVLHSIAPTLDHRGVELLVRRRLAIADGSGCPSTPVLIRIEPGQPTRTLAAVCEVPLPVTVTRLEAVPAGLLVHAHFGLEAYHWDGRPRWRYEPDPACRLERWDLRCPYVLSAIATPDGGAWLVEGDAEEVDRRDDTIDRIVRVSPEGAVRRFPLPEMPTFSDTSLLLRGDDAELDLLWMDPEGARGALGVLRQRLDGSTQQAEVVLQEYPYGLLEDAVRLGDGGLLVAYRPWGWLLCAPIQPCSNPAEVLRLDSRNSLSWRMPSSFDYVEGVALAPDGSAWFTAGYAPARVERVDARGERGAIFTSPLQEPYYSSVLVPLDGQSALHLGRSGAHRIDAHGQSSASAAWSDVAPGGSVVSARGVLLQRYDAANSLSLVSREDFAPRADFELVHPSVPAWAPWMQNLASGRDGQHAVVRTMHSPVGTRGVFLARFDEPDSPAALRIFVDGLEP